MSETNEKVTVIGAGMAGCEAAYTLAKQGVEVDLYEMRPEKSSPAHKTDQLGELVCSNSLGSDQADSPSGLLKEEMLSIGSLIISSAGKAKVPAGKALAVDRDIFSSEITKVIESHPKIHLIRKECPTIPEEGLVIVATGPLTSEELAEDLKQYIGEETLYFYDSISPIVSAESIDESKVFYASRWEEDEKDYLNCPMDKEEYEAFVTEIQNSERTPLHSFEKPKYFEGCMPVEVMADRGIKTLSFGPMKPIGLTDPKTGRRPYAVVQLRKENEPTTMYNLVGFQTRMKWGEQKRVFSMIPGLEKAEFIRMGSIHRNTFIESPRLLNSKLEIKTHPRIQIAGQIVGVEGYVESAAMGQWAGLVAAAKIKNEELKVLPPETAMGALLKTITTLPVHGKFAPMNVNFGIFTRACESRDKKTRRANILERGRNSFSEWNTQRAAQV